MTKQILINAFRFMREQIFASTILVLVLFVLYSVDLYIKIDFLQLNKPLGIFLFSMVDFWIKGLFLSVLLNKYADAKIEYINKNIFFSKYYLKFFLFTFVYFFSIAIGLVLLILPGIFAFIALCFLPLISMASDEKFFDYFKKSYSLVKGKLFYIFIMSIIINLHIILQYALSAYETLLFNLLFAVYVPISLSILFSTWHTLNSNKNSL